LQLVKHSSHLRKAKVQRKSIEFDKYGNLSKLMGIQTFYNNLGLNLYIIPPTSYGVPISEKGLR